MSEQLIPWVITGIAMLSAMLFALVFMTLLKEVPETDRRYMDPLPLPLRMIWPAVGFIAVHVAERLPVELLEKMRGSLNRSGLSYLLTPEQLFGLQLLSVAFFFSVSHILLGALATPSIALSLAIGLLGFLFPFLSIRDRRLRREKEIVRSLSVYLDFITMAVEAGLNLNGALLQAVEKGPDGALKLELHRVLRDIKAGMNRSDALRSLAERLQLREITTLVSALLQAEKTGASIGKSLRIQAEQRRVERFQRAEKQALEAPVKLIFPLVTFIFPTTFIILGFPIAMKFMYEL